MHNFFDAIGVADMEKVHSAVIGWMLSDKCLAFSIETRSKLLQDIFEVKEQVKCFDSSGELSIFFDGQEDEPLNVKVHFLENYNDRSSAVVNATNVVGEDLKSYTETDIKAYKTLWDLKKGTQKSYISYLNSVLKLLKKKELPSFVNRKPKTINNWKSAIESAKAIMSDIEDKR